MSKPASLSTLPCTRSCTSFSVPAVFHCLAPSRATATALSSAGVQVPTDVNEAVQGLGHHDEATAAAELEEARLSGTLEGFSMELESDLQDQDDPASHPQDTDVAAGSGVSRGARLGWDGVEAHQQDTFSELPARPSAAARQGGGDAKMPADGQQQQQQSGLEYKQSPPAASMHGQAESVPDRRSQAPSAQQQQHAGHPPEQDGAMGPEMQQQPSSMPDQDPVQGAWDNGACMQHSLVGTASVLLYSLPHRQ